MTDAQQKKLRAKAGVLLSRRAHSRGEIRMKLLKIAEERAVEIVLDRLEQLKLLNDVEYAYNFAFRRIGREGWGPGKIRSALARRQVRDSDISAVLGRIRNEIGDDYGLAEYLSRYMGKRGLPQDPKSKGSLFRHLQRRGFHRDTIHRVLNQMLPSEF